MYVMTVDQRRAFIGAHTTGFSTSQVKMTRQLRMKMANSSLVKTLVILYVCLILEATCAGHVYSSLVGQGPGMMRSGMLGWRKVRVRVREPTTMNSTRPQQQCLDTKAELLSLLGKGLYPVLCRCGLVCLLGGYGAGVIEMLLMMSGDVEPNPGPIGVLGPDDLRAVLTQLVDVCADWENIGLELGLTPGTLDAIKGPFKDHRDCLRDMLKKWLNTSPAPSWEGLVQALRSPIVGKVGLARQLEAKFCTQEGGRPPEEREDVRRQNRAPQSWLGYGWDLARKAGMGLKLWNSPLSNTLERFANYLRMTYNIQVPDFAVLQWPPPPTSKVFNLAMIHRHTIRYQSPNEELVRLMLRGRVSSVMEGKTSIQLEKLFTQSKEHESRRRQVVLIEGAPGAGKSTLAWHVCQKWAAGELFQEFDIVIYIQLRDPKVQSAKSLANLLPTHPEIKNEDVAAEIVKVFGKGVLFVLDGWDEYEPELREDSFVKSLICKPENLNLHNSTLLITSRPVASAAIQYYCSSRVEIVGFTPDEVRRYFEDALEDPLAVQKLQDQLRERPVIEASCYLPLNAAIVAHLFKELNYVLPVTLHGVFLAVVCGCIRRYLRKQSGKNEAIPSLNELPSAVKQDFQKMCTLAFKGTLANKVTFSGQDLRSYGLSAEWNVLDLMQIVQSFASRESKLCHFLHLTVQELLTARYISELSNESEQVRIIEDIFGKPRFAAVFRFYAAFTKLRTEGIRDVVARIATSRRKPDLLNLMHCLYEAQDVSLCCFVSSHLDKKLNLESEHLSALDCLSVGYFLSCVCLGTSEEFEVQCFLDDYTVRFLARGLCSQVCSSPGVEESGLHGDSLSGCVVLNLSSNRLHGGGIRHLSDAIKHPSTIKKLNLVENEIQQEEDGLKYLLQALKTNTSLVELHLSSCGLKITDDNGPLLVEMLSENRTLQELDLRNNSIGATGLAYISKGLTRNTGLVKLSLSYCSLEITDDHGPLLVDLLSENRTLQELDLRYNYIGATGLAYISKGLTRNTGLVKLSLTNCSLRITDDNGPLLVEILSENRTLQELDLGYNSIGATGLAYISKGLTRNTGLVKLLLSVCSLQITDDNGPLLVEMLSENRTLEELDLSENILITGEGLLILGEGLKANWGLKKLSMSNLPRVTNECWKKFTVCNHRLTQNLNPYARSNRLH